MAFYPGPEIPEIIRRYDIPEEFKQVIQQIALKYDIRTGYVDIGGMYSSIATASISTTGYLNFYILGIPSDAKKTYCCRVEISPNESKTNFSFIAAARHLKNVYFGDLLNQSTSISINAVGPAPSNLAERILIELQNRGDFEIDIPALVDVLFKLGVVIPKEDVSEESEENTSDEYIKKDTEELPF